MSKMATATRPLRELCTRSNTSGYANRQHRRLKAEELHATPASGSSLPTAPLASATTTQPSTTRHFADPTLVASLLSLPSTSVSADLPLPATKPSSSLADHVSTKTKQAIHTVSRLSLIYCCQKTLPFN